MEKKLRHSHQRDMIYNYLMSTKEHPSAEMVYEALRPEIANLSLGTVYRNLKLLEEMGKVKSVTTYQNVVRYDGFTDDHAHFVCESCGKIIDLPSIDNDMIADACELNKEEVKWVSLLVGGKCSDCKKV